MERYVFPFHSRRDFMKMLGSLAAVGLTTSLTPDLLYAKPKTDLKGVKIDYWCMVQQQNPIIKKLCISFVKAFEQRTGAKVNLTLEGYGSIIGPKYRTNFTAGKKPTVFDANPRWTGAVRRFLRPMNDFIENDFDPKAREAVSWFYPLIKDQNRGVADKEDIKDQPFMFIAQAPLVTRLDHWKKAGLDYAKDAPIKDTDQYLEICKAMKTSKVTEYPTEVYGKIWDAGDTQLNGWIRSLDIPLSYFINQDWTKSNCDSEPWIKGLQFYVDLFRKYHYSSPDSPQSSDEVAVEQLIQGRKSLIHCDILNRGTFMARMPQQVKDGTIQWMPHFPLTEGKTGSCSFLSIQSMSIVKQEGPDAEIKEQAAWELTKEFLSAENQVAMAKSAGICARRDLWDQLKGEPDNYAESIFGMMNNPGVWTNHPKGVDIQYNLFAPHAQKALGGSDVATELKAYAEKVNKVLAR